MMVNKVSVWGESVLERDWFCGGEYGWDANPTFRARAEGERIAVR